MDQEEAVVCRYKYCLHHDKKLLKSESICRGKSYYHPECFKTQQEIKEIIDVFSKNVNSNVVYSQLVNVINHIVFKKELGSNFLLFGLKYYVENHIPINYPQGLYYVIQNKKVISAYDKEIAKKNINIIKENAAHNYSEENYRDFGYVHNKKNTIQDLIGW